MSRIQFSRDQLLADFVEVGEPPEVLLTKFQRAPFCHLLSKYVIRPVACDQLPFFIHHKNKQPIFMPQEKKIRRPTGTKEVQGFSSSEEEDEFEKVKTDNKRAANAAKKTIPDTVANPSFPASDPTKVKVVAPAASGKKVVDKVPSKMGLDLNAVKSEDMIVRPGTSRKDKVISEPVEEQKVANTARPATAKKQKAAPKKQEVNYFAEAMKQNETGGKPAKTETAPVNPPQSTGGKKNKNKQAPEEKKKVEEKPKEEKPKQVQQAPKKAPVAQAPPANDFMAQMAAGAQKTQEQESQKKANKSKKRAGQAVQEPDFAKTNYKEKGKNSGMAGLYD